MPGFVFRKSVFPKVKIIKASVFQVKNASKVSLITCIHGINNLYKYMYMKLRNSINQIALDIKTLRTPFVINLVFPFDLSHRSHIDQ